MGKKKSSSKNQYVFEDSVDNDADQGPGFAEKLLASMGIDKEKGIPEEAVDSETSTSQEIKHPHLHSIHKSVTKVFKGHSSKSDASGKSSSSKSSSSAQDQLDELANDSEEEPSAVDLPKSSSEDDVTQPKKRNRRREKLAERERERARIVQEAQEEAKTIPDKRAIELKGMEMMISKCGLVEYEVQPDGHCLFHSLCDQLEQRRHIKTEAQHLRSALANFIRTNPDDFVPYLIEDESGDVKDVATYTNDLEHTALWGGELELMAASRLYEVPIKVFFATQPAMIINKEIYEDEKPLTLAYYQSKFGLGAHYNSLRDNEDSNNLE